jgi:hypothetical protein
MLMVLLSWSPAAWGIELFIPALETKPGETIEVPVKIDTMDNLAGIKLVMKYDKGLLTYKSAAKTQQTSSLMHVVNDKNPGVLIVVMAGARGIKGKDFAVINLTFETAKDLKGNHTTEIKITEAQLMSDKLKDHKFTIKVHPIRITTKE